MKTEEHRTEILFSVVIPAHNEERRIEECLESVLRQTTRPSEVIVVDDGSTDATTGIVERFVERDPGFIHLLTQDNEGVSAARNKGIRKAESEWVAFLDGDDEWEPFFLEEIHSLIREFPGAVMYRTGHWIVDREIGQFRPQQGLPTEFRGRVTDFFAAVCRGPIGNSSCTVVSREAILGVGGFPEGETVGEDLYTWVQMASAGEVVYSGRPCSRIHQGLPKNLDRRTDRVSCLITRYGERADRESIDPGLKGFLWQVAKNDLLNALAYGTTSGFWRRFRAGRKIFPVRLWQFAPLGLVKFTGVFSGLKSIRRRVRKARVSGRPDGKAESSDQ